MNIFGVKRPWGGQWGYFETSNSGWIRLHDSVSQESKSLHKISSRNNTLNIPIKIYLRLSLSSSTELQWHHNDVFFAAGTSYWTTGSSAESVTLHQKSPGIYDIYEFLFFPVIPIFDAMSFCGHFDRSSFN